MTHLSLIYITTACLSNTITCSQFTLHNTNEKQTKKNLTHKYIQNKYECMMAA